MFVLLTIDRFECAKDAVCAGIDADWRDIAPTDDTGPVDHEERALARALICAVHTVPTCDVAFRLEVSEQRKVEFAIPGEREVAPRPVHRNSQELRVESPELLEDLVVQRHL